MQKYLPRLHNLLGAILRQHLRSRGQKTEARGQKRFCIVGALFRAFPWFLGMRSRVCCTILTLKIRIHSRQMFLHAGIALQEKLRDLRDERILPSDDQKTTFVLNARGWFLWSIQL